VSNTNALHTMQLIPFSWQRAVRAGLGDPFLRVSQETEGSDDHRQLELAQRAAEYLIPSHLR